jgi:hypothetical protein
MALTICPPVRAALFGAAAILAANTAAATTMNLDYDLFADGGQDDFADDLLNEGDIAFAETGPIAVTFSNIVTGNGAAAAPIDYDGIFFSNTRWYNAVKSVDLTFAVDTVIDAYDIDFTTARRGSYFQISGVNGTTGQNRVARQGDFTFDMGSIDVFLAGETYTLTHTAGGRGFFQIDEFSVSLPAVPLPAAGMMLLGGMGLLAGLQRMRRTRAQGGATRKA